MCCVQQTVRHLSLVARFRSVLSLEVAINDFQRRLQGTEKRRHNIGSRSRCKLGPLILCVRSYSVSGLVGALWLPDCEGWRGAREIWLVVCEYATGAWFE